MMERHLLNISVLRPESSHYYAFRFPLPDNPETIMEVFFGGDLRILRNYRFPDSEIAYSFKGKSGEIILVGLTTGDIPSLLT